MPTPILAFRLAAATASAALFTSTAQAQKPVAPPPGFDGYVAQVLKTFTVPGVAIAIVKDGKVVLAKGYGVRRLGDPTPVDGQTQFGIASNTKLFTATALATLVEAGRIEWDAPVIRYLPSFAMYDPYVTRELTVRDLLVHRSGLGLGAGDLLWWPASTYDRQEIARRLRYIKPATSFRTAYAYDNVLYLVAGELIEAVSGQSWEDYVRTHILEPAGMTHSDVRHSAAGRGGNVATPHAEVNDTVRPVAPFLSDNTNPAGGIVSGAEDLARWLVIQLDSGRVAGGAAIFSPASTRQLWREVTPEPIGDPTPGLEELRPRFLGYALGVETRDFRGKQMLTHTGGLPGYVSRLAMIPELRLGVAVLTNQESGLAFNALVYRVLDHYLGAKSPDYVGIYGRLLAQNRSKLAADAAAASAERDSTSGPSLAPARYAGLYRDAWYGDVSIAQENGGLVIRMKQTPGMVGDLRHWQHDTFLARWRDRELRADAYVTFALNPDGSIDQVRMAPASADVDFSFDFQDLLLRPVASGAP
ncbi:MAG TPA: serine hydrolase [Gemmatimonadales bacterium]|nr:serine hydrolase [Gemmatimonadales bacterium]